ncbi:hypothetical protein D9M71_347730 [compost metagenome]
MVEAEARRSATEFDLLAVARAAGLNRQTGEFGRGPTYLGHLHGRHDQRAVCRAVVAQAVLPVYRRHLTAGGEPLGSESVLLQGVVTGRHHRHEFQRLDPAPGQRAVLDMIDKAQLETLRPVSALELGNLDPVTRGAGEQM